MKEIIQVTFEDHGQLVVGENGFDQKLIEGPQLDQTALLVGFRVDLRKACQVGKLRKMGAEEFEVLGVHDGCLFTTAQRSYAKGEVLPGSVLGRGFFVHHCGLSLGTLHTSLEIDGKPLVNQGKRDLFPLSTPERNQDLLIAGSFSIESDF